MMSSPGPRVDRERAPGSASAPSHHPTEELLVDYASGAAPEAVALFVASHLALCPRCRREVEILEQVGGAVLSEVESDIVVPEIDLERLDELAQAVAEPSRPRGVPAHPEWRMLPEPLRSYVPATPAGRIDWTFKMPGMRYLDLPVAWGNIPVRISVLLGGSIFPSHGHPGLELSMVLSGGYSDRGEDYLRGDVCVADPSLTHHLDVHRGAECVLLVVSEHRMIPRSLLAKLLARLFPV